MLFAARFRFRYNASSTRVLLDNGLALPVELAALNSWLHWLSEHDRLDADIEGAADSWESCIWSIFGSDLARLRGIELLFELPRVLSD